MASGDLTRDASSPTIDGNRRVLTGTIEADYVRRNFALGGTGIRLLGCEVTSEDGVASAQVQINQDAAGVETNGTIAVFASTKEAATFRYRATFL